MGRFLIGIALFIAIGAAIYFNRRIPTPEEVEFQTRFDREAVLVKTCAPDPGLASGSTLKVYRFEGELWFSDVGRWRRIDGKPENVCDLLDIDAAHRPQASPQPLTVNSILSSILDLFRRPEPEQSSSPPPKKSKERPE